MPGASATDAVLLESGEPAIRHRALVDLERAGPRDRRVVEARKSILDGPIVSALLEDRDGRHPYSKWTGAHWRLTSLMDLGVPPDLPTIPEQLERILRWIPGRNHPDHARAVAGRHRLCASQEGNVLAVAVHFGHVQDPRVELIAANLADWQWPDGGWNCDTRETTTHASVNETFPAIRGLAWFAAASPNAGAARTARAAADRAAEFLLRHRVAFSHRTGRPMHPVVMRLHYPPYWHYDLLAGLRVLVESGHIADPRTADALDQLEAKRRADGLWAADERHYRAPGSSSLADVVEWERRDGKRGDRPNEALTLSALRVLRAAGRLG